MDKSELQNRTKKFAVNIIKFVDTLPANRSLNILSNQLLRCSSSVGANYRSACKGKSTADFINKIVIVEEEADESIYWLELIEEAGLSNAKDVTSLKKEASEHTAILQQLVKRQRQIIKKNQLEKINSKSNIRNPI